MHEEPLPGGNVGVVVRVGDTVRRGTGPWTPVVHELLQYLERAGFAYAPRVLGIDDRGREILTFIAGETAGEHHPWAPWVWSDATLTQAARILREYHDAVADFRPTGVHPWRLGTAPLTADEIVCHNDYAPYNLVWRDDRIYGVIDWDLAGPGAPAWDVAFSVWTFAPIHTESHSRQLGAPVEIERRTTLFCDAYGLDERRGFVELVHQRMDASIRGIEEAAARGEPSFQSLLAGGHVARMREDRAIPLN